VGHSVSNLEAKLVGLTRVFVPTHPRGIPGGGVTIVDAYWKNISSLDDLDPEELAAYKAGLDQPRPPDPFNPKAAAPAKWTFDLNDPVEFQVTPGKWEQGVIQGIYPPGTAPPGVGPTPDWATTRTTYKVRHPSGVEHVVAADPGVLRPGPPTVGPPLKRSLRDKLLNIGAGVIIGLEEGSAGGAELFEKLESKVPGLGEWSTVMGEVALETALHSAPSGESVELTRIWIPPYPNPNPAEDPIVDGHWREIDSLDDLNPDERAAVERPGLPAPPDLEGMRRQAAADRERFALKAAGGGPFGFGVGKPRADERIARFREAAKEDTPEGWGRYDAWLNQTLDDMLLRIGYKIEGPPKPGQTNPTVRYLGPVPSSRQGKEAAIDTGQPDLAAGAEQQVLGQPWWPSVEQVFPEAGPGPRTGEGARAARIYAETANQRLPGQYRAVGNVVYRDKPPAALRLLTDLQPAGPSHEDLTATPWLLPDHMKYSHGVPHLSFAASTAAHKKAHNWSTPWGPLPEDNPKAETGQLLTGLRGRGPTAVERLRAQVGSEGRGPTYGERPNPLFGPVDLQRDAASVREIAPRFKGPLGDALWGLARAVNRGEPDEVSSAIAAAEQAAAGTKLSPGDTQVTDDAIEEAKAYLASLRA
jgi:hypothetical protein